MLKQGKCHHSHNQGTGEKITVANKKGCVFLQRLGQAPFAIVDTKRGLAVVPDGFCVSTFSDKEWWIAETKVEQVDGVNTAFYRFTSQRQPVQSDWKDTPTEAYKEVNDSLKTGFRGGGNGQLIIGCTYPSLQQRIFVQHPEAAKLVDRTDSNNMAAVDRRRRRVRPRRATDDSSDMQASVKRTKYDTLSSSSQEENNPCDEDVEICNYTLYGDDQLTQDAAFPTTWNENCLPVVPNCEMQARPAKTEHEDLQMTNGARSEVEMFADAEFLHQGRDQLAELKSIENLLDTSWEFEQEDGIMDLVYTGLADEISIVPW